MELPISIDLESMSDSFSEEVRMKVLANGTAILCAILIAGCAVTPQRAAEADTRQLCIWYMSPFLGDSDRATAYQELSRRNVLINTVCTRYSEENAQMFSLGVQMMQESRPKPAPSAYTDCYQTANGYRCEHHGQTYFNCQPSGNGYLCQ